MSVRQRGSRFNVQRRPSRPLSSPAACNLLVFDTSVLFDHLRTNRFADAVQRLEGVIRFSAVVLAELYRGARTRTEEMVPFSLVVW